MTALFEAKAEGAELDFAKHEFGTYEYRYQFTIGVPEFNELRDVRVFWSPLRATSPVTHLPGIACRRHRNLDRYRSLCLWYPEDSPEKRWSPEGGLKELHDMTVVHAWCEARCRQGLAWPKPEAPKPHPRPEGCRACPKHWRSCP